MVVLLLLYVDCCFCVVLCCLVFWLLPFVVCCLLLFIIDCWWLLIVCYLFLLIKLGFEKSPVDQPAVIRMEIICRCDWVVILGWSHLGFKLQIKTPSSSGSSLWEGGRWYLIDIILGCKIRMFLSQDVSNRGYCEEKGLGFVPSPRHVTSSWWWLAS